MPVEQFSKSEFESALPTHKDTSEPLWESLGLVKGEYCYAVPVTGTNKRIVIRSSVGPNGFSAKTGADSIRLQCQYFYPKANEWFYLAKLDRWTTRVPGWERRMTEKLRELWQIALDDSKHHHQPQAEESSKPFRQVCPNCLSPNVIPSDDNEEIICLECNYPNHVQDSICPKCGSKRVFYDGIDLRCKECDYLDQPSGFDPPDDKSDANGADKSKNQITNEGSKDRDLPVPLGGGEGQEVDYTSTPSETSDRDVEDSPPPTSRFELPLGNSAEATLIDEVEEPESEKPKIDKPRPEPNEDQRAAITAPIGAAVRVLAGPGSGKTFCTEERVAFLLENGAKSEDILAVTFSKTMADSSLERIIGRNPELEGTAAEKQICTIHAICYRMLRDSGDRRSVSKDWQIKKALNEIAEKLWPYADDRPGWKEVYQWIGLAKYKGLTTAEDLSFYIDNLGDYHGRNVHEARRQFDERMRGQKLLTFPDMLFDVEQKLKRETPFRVKWQQRFKWVLADEFQDTSGQAMRILTTLAQPQNQMFAVGDDCQLLYRFAGATPEDNLFQGFDERYPDNVTIHLKINYRSTHEIVNQQMGLIKYNYASNGGPYDDRFMKSLEPRPNAPEGQPVTFQEYEDVFEEADALVEAIQEQLANGHEPGHIFVCSRTRAQLGYAEGPLVRAKVPFINICGGSFWGSKHVADVVAYLRLAFDNSNDVAFKRVYNVASNWNVHPWGEQKGEYCHHRYLGRAFMDACGNSYSGVWNAVSRRHSFQPGVEDLTQFMQELEAALASAPTPGAVIRQIVEDCYKKYLAADEGITVSDDAENGKLEDLETVIEVADQFETVEEFLGYVDEAVQAAEAAKDKSWDNYVVLSSVHRLKGLERDIVFVLGCSENGERGLLPHTFSLTEPPQMGILPTGGKGRVEDERCIMFVAVSRAKSECHLSGMRRYRKDVFGPSRFVHEMGLVADGVTDDGADPAGMDLDNLLENLTFQDVKDFLVDHADHPIAEAWVELMLDDEIAHEQGSTCYTMDDYREAARETVNQVEQELNEFKESLGEE